MTPGEDDVNLDYDVDAMLERAIRLARMGTGRVEPNPRVGALVIREAPSWGRATTPPTEALTPR